jgi:hypothetical protein
MTHQGLLPFRPKPSAYLGELQRSQASLNPEEGEDRPLRSEHALVSSNTQRAQDLQQGETQDACLNLKQFLPPNTAERYYFSSPAKSALAQDAAAAGNHLPTATAPTSSSTIWSVARMSASVSTTLSSSSSSTLQHRPNSLPVGIGSVSIYKTSHSVAPSSSLIPLLPGHSAAAIKDRTADILSPVTESATVLSFINKTSTLMASNGGSRIFEIESDPPALSAYLQERAAVRAASKTTPFIVMGATSSGSSSSVSPKNVAVVSSAHEVAASVVTSTAVQAVSAVSAPAPPVSSVSAKPSFGAVVHHTEDKYAPRNVTMNVKDLPEDVTGGATSRHPQLPQDIHLAAANALAKATPATTADSGSADAKSSSSSADRDCQGRSTSEPTEIFQTNDDGKSVCGICSKVFAKASQLRLHVNIHYFERPFRCDSCAVSFRTKGHLQKHKRSVGHFNKVTILRISIFGRKVSSQIFILQLWTTEKLKITNYLTNYGHNYFIEMHYETSYLNLTFATTYLCFIRKLRPKLIHKIVPRSTSTRRSARRRPRTHGRSSASTARSLSASTATWPSTCAPRCTS